MLYFCTEWEKTEQNYEKLWNIEMQDTCTSLAHDPDKEFDQTPFVGDL